MGLETSPSFVFASPTDSSTRTNRPTEQADYTLAETDMGVVFLAGGNCYLPTYDSYQDGKAYDITNQTANVIVVHAAAGESFMVLGQLVATITIRAGLSRQIARETTTHNWILV